MSWSAVGSLVQASASTFTLTPGNVGDLVLVEVIQISNTTVNATALASSNVNWQQIAGPFVGTHQNGTVSVFAGRVTSNSAQTVTVTWSGTTPASIRIVGREFSSTAGAWAMDKVGNINSAGTSTWPSLTPYQSGDLYWGYSINSASAVAGATSGFTYEADSHSNGEAFKLSCSGATGPVWGDSTQVLGLAVLMREIAFPDGIDRLVDVRGAVWVVAVQLGAGERLPDDVERHARISVGLELQGHRPAAADQQVHMDRAHRIVLGIRA
jgi:hypothetical protein